MPGILNMKKILLIIAMLWGVAQGQTVGWLRYDTVKMAKNGGTTELVLENATKAVTGGVLTNTGNGRTAWVTPSGAQKFGVSGEDVLSTGNRTFNNSTFTFNQSFTSSLDANHTLGINQNPAAASYSYNIFAQEIDGGNNPLQYFSVATDRIFLDAGSSFGLHKNIQVRLDSLIIGGFSTSGAANLKRTIVVSGNSADVLSFPQLLSSANADDSMLVMDASSKIVGMRAIPSAGGSQTPWTSAINADGFTLFGNDGSGQDLTLGSTSHATKGKILFGTSTYDEVNNRLGIGTASPSDRLHVAGVGAGAGVLVTGTTSPSLILKGGGSPAVYFQDGGGTSAYIAMNASYDVSLALPGWGAPAIQTLQATNRVGIANATPTSTLHVNGSFATAYTAQTTTYPITTNDYTIECTSGTFTTTLPTAVGCTGRIYFITNSGAGTITLATTSSQTFVNVVATPTTLTLATLTGVTVQSNGANWLKINGF